ncbi:hypothetical protein [Streptomyces dangxiongensis]|uniref:hypothetical protein n=1 Tax=Streptomyces dangxiongensis TaxID=1442032 RepID=UPI0013CE79B6|nr:hypothetical protein [Streptomyces dangxiongensis]
MTTVPKATARLPEGWKPLESAPASDGARHWYATAPFSAEALREQYGEEAAGLAQTVDGPSWQHLCTEAWGQDEQYKRLTGGEA